MTLPLPTEFAAILLRLDQMAFRHAATLAERVDQVYAVCDQRLYSHQLALVWADWLNMHAASLSRAEQVRLVKEMLVLSPNHHRSQELFDAIMTGQERLQPANTPVFMITSCVKYIDKARVLRQALTERGALAWIITGDAQASVPTWHEEGCVLAVPDTYEALPLKVAKGVEALVERYGHCSIVKIDDDCSLLPHFSVERFTAEALAHDYVGVLCQDPMHDRLWHHGKTQSDVGVYARRFHGGWARGACYLLGPTASRLVAREAVMYPGEFACEHYEDKAMGDFMRRQGVSLHALPADADWGITFEFQERPLKRAVASQVSAPTPVQSEPAPVSTSLMETPVMNPDTPTQAPVATPRSRQRIPKVLHLTWVGDESKCPHNCIQTWVDHNPDWTVKLWGNADLQNQSWVNARHIKAMWNKELNGVADMMRWEILYNEGGIVVDADSICVRPLDDWLLEADAIACWENEITRPRLIGCNMIGAVPENPFIGQIIQDIHAEESVVHDMAWKTVGPLRITTAYFKYRYTGLTILPSHFFIPDHFSGVHYEGGGIVYAKQEWASTHRAYDNLHLKQVA